MIEFNYYEDIPTNFTGVCKVTIIGNIYHVKDGEIHNENGPAVIYSDGSKRWYINNLEHREDGPSTEHSNGQMVKKIGFIKIHVMVKMKILPLKHG